MTERHFVKSVMLNNGGVLYPPPWSGLTGADKFSDTPPDVYKIGTDQLYPTGTIYRVGLRTFIYTKTGSAYYGSGGAGVGAGYLMESAAEVEDLSGAVISGVKDSNEIVVNMGAACAKDAYAGGFIGIMGQSALITTVGGYQEYQILSNTKQDGSNHVTFTIDGTLPTALASGDHCTMTEHPYATVRHPQNDIVYGGCVGALLCTTVASSYLWLQTGGPHTLIHPRSTFEGVNGWHANVYDVCGVANCGNMEGQTPDGTHEVDNLQCIGWVYASSLIGGYASPVATDNTIAIAVFLTIFN